jgi:hypothetical protein
MIALRHSRILNLFPRSGRFPVQSRRNGARIEEFGEIRAALLNIMKAAEPTRFEIAGRRSMSDAIMQRVHNRSWRDVKLGKVLCGQRVGLQVTAANPEQPRLCFARFRAKLRPQPGKSLLHRKLARSPEPDSIGLASFAHSKNRHVCG